MFSKALLYTFLLWGLIGQLALATTGRLGIQKDDSVSDNGLVSLGSVCQFDTAPSNAIFLAMVKQAYDDMTKAAPSKGKTPSAMIGLAIGNEVYFSSSVKGGKKTIVYEAHSDNGGTGKPNPNMPERYHEVTKALEDCSTEQQKQHVNNGMCGELTSTLSWMIDHPGKKPRDEQPRVAAWNKKGYLPPCGTEEKWGCNKWTGAIGATVVPNGTVADSFPNPKHVDHVSLNKCMVKEESKSESKGEDGPTSTKR